MADGNLAAMRFSLALVDLDAEHPLPEAPWFEKGAGWSARRGISWR
jgi:hypothetical protein